MKPIYTLSLLLAGMLFTQSCTTSQSALRELNDDVYYTPSDDKYAKAPVENSNNDRKYGSQANPDSEGNYQRDSYRNPGNSAGDNYVNNNYYYNDYDNYNYHYSSRINRFYRPSVTFGYYDPFYSPFMRHNMGLGLSMHFGNSFMPYDPFFNPYYDPFFSPFNYGFYNPYSYYYMNPYNSYNRGYMHGYYDSRYMYGNNWSSGNTGRGTGGGGGSSNTYYGPRGTQGGHNILNSGANSLPDRFKRETPVKENNPRGGNLPSTDQPKQENGVSRPRFDSQPRYDAPRSNDNNTYERAPEKERPRFDRNNTPYENKQPSYSTPKNNNTPNPSYEAPKQNSTPRFEQRQNTTPRFEQRQQTRPQNDNYSTPRNNNSAPSMPRNDNYSTPRNNGGGGGGGSSPRRF